jgi:hypothetical protein
MGNKKPLEYDSREPAWVDGGQEQTLSEYLGEEIPLSSLRGERFFTAVATDVLSTYVEGYPAMDSRVLEGHDELEVICAKDLVNYVVVGYAGEEIDEGEIRRRLYSAGISRRTTEAFVQALRKHREDIAERIEEEKVVEEDKVMRLFGEIRSLRWDAVGDL